ncbi:sensor histidine kinase [Roseateles sp. DAIF2]|uniref:sensor histidine kinase n=1 Tax=Roseateles sp. DAIF2 TaxID=2714952 RepID=UPI0018A32B91|nr:sensor histidine kinase [Roseateles sp. DAIF2]QPF73641.1 sensor histidine kinase [Roseateles sp. DAIF2]
MKNWLVLRCWGRICGWLALLGLVGLSALAQAQPPLRLDPERALSSGGHLAMLRDPEGRLEAEAAAAAPGWRALPGPLNIGYTNDVIWLRLVVQRPAGAAPDWLLQFSHALLDDVRLFRQDEQGQWRLAQRSGEDVGRGHWAIDARNVLLPLRLPEQEPETLLLRLRTKNAMSTYLTLMTPEVHTGRIWREYLVYGLGFGFGLLLIAFHLLFWQMTRERLSAWYLLYVSNALLVEALTAGLPQQLFDMPVWLSDPMLGLSMCAGLAIGIRFAGMQLGLDQRWPGFFRWSLRVVTGLSLVAAVLVLTGRNGAGMLAMQPVAMLSIVLLLGAACWLLPRDKGQARAFLLIFGVYYAGVLLSFVRNLGWLPTNVWTNNVAALGTLLHMVLMSMRLNRRYDQERRDKESAQARIVEIVGKHNERLEQAVRARTTDLRQEIAQRERLEQELRAALETERRAKQSQLDFVAMVSHEFRTPLAIINTTAQQIARNLDAVREKTLARCMNLRSAAQRMAALVDEYLTADRMDTGQSPFQPRDCEREELVDLLDDLVADWPEGRVLLRDEQQLPERLHCDPGLLRVALRNLLANADRHTEPGRVIELQVFSPTPGGLSLRVSNPGDEVPADEVPRLFEKYFRGRQALQAPGAGLGLYLVRQIAEMHAGQARLESAGRGEPVRFRLDLPLPA